MSVYSQKTFKLQYAHPEKFGKHQVIAMEALALVNELVNSQAFKDSVLARKYDWVQLDAGSLPEMPPQEVFRKLYQENPTPIIDFRIVSRFKFIRYWLGSTVGFSDGDVTYTFTSNFFNTPDKHVQDVIFYASHIAHEFCHHINFADTTRKPESAFRDVVPYAIGDIVCRMLNKKLNLKSECDK